MNYRLVTAILVLAGGVGFTETALAQASDSYCATISQQDKFASDGFRLDDPASMIRQDRANYHRFGIRDAGDEGDSTFRNPAARERIAAMIDAVGMTPAVSQAILNGTPNICVNIYGTRAMEVFLAEQNTAGPGYEAYPFEGVWNCEVATFSFTPFTYNNGSEDLPIQEIQEGSDGSYTLLFDDDYWITLSGFSGNRMGWFSGASGDSFNCTRLE